MLVRDLYLKWFSVIWNNYYNYILPSEIIVANYCFIIVFETLISLTHTHINEHIFIITEIIWVYRWSNLSMDIENVSLELYLPSFSSDQCTGRRTETKEQSEYKIRKFRVVLFQLALLWRYFFMILSISFSRPMFLVCSKNF